MNFINTQPITINHSPANASINPNNADWPSLARLPGIGESKAKAIIRYRNQPASQGFKTAMDLKNIKGIGDVTVQNIAPYLNFDKE